jgi:hypothetical protein
MPCAMSRQPRPLIAAALLIGLLGGTLPAAAQSRSSDAGASGAAASGVAASSVAASSVAATSVENTPGGKGAKVYCFMRAAGNTHQVSWDAAYALIKRQSDSLFKTSPEHAAVMITEAVVNNPSTFPDCGKFLGDLYAK